MRVLLAVIALLVAPLVGAQDIAGVWKAAEGPGWIEITVTDGVGTAVVQRNDNHPERVGRELVRDIRSSEGESAEWQAELYAEALGEYKDATLTMTDDNNLKMTVKVGFLSRSVEWVRVEAVPEQ